MTKSGTVIPTDLAGAQNQVFHSGDKVTESDVPRGKWEKLVKGGYIKEDAAKPEARKKK